jgi:UDP-N-acetylmuramoyl-tripeptide--D-alanyl-D-alanine ligase
VVTNVGPTHLERLGSLVRIARAKLELPQALPSAGDGGLAILNIDDEWVRGMADQTKARVFTYGLDRGADLWADGVESDGLEGIRLRFHHEGETVDVRLPMLGRHSAHTALCAAAVGLNEGLSWPDIMAGLSDPSAQLRLLALSGPNGSTILDDTYNASPVSCIAALDLLDELNGRKIAVLGDMYELGSYEEDGHRLVGRHARDVADILITVGQLGRTIADEAVKSGMPVDSVLAVETNAQAVTLLGELLADGPGCDQVLIKGSRGMGMEEIVGALTQT